MESGDDSRRGKGHTVLDDQSTGYSERIQYPGLSMNVRGNEGGWSIAEEAGVAPWLHTGREDIQFEGWASESPVMSLVMSLR